MKFGYEELEVWNRSDYNSKYMSADYADLHRF